MLDNTLKKPKLVNPRTMIVFAHPKVGKTRLFLNLPGSYLLLDFEEGSHYYGGHRIDIPDFKTFWKLRKELAAKKKMYDFIVLDTLTSMYKEVVNTFAVKLYNSDNGKKHPDNFDIETIAYGVGLKYKWKAAMKLIEILKKHCKTLIISAHVIERKSGETTKELGIKEIAIDGKFKHILALSVDAIGYLYRSDDFENTLSFNPSSGFIGGTRCEHLTGKEFIVSEKDEDTGVLTVNWSKIFI